MSSSPFIPNLKTEDNQEVSPSTSEATSLNKSAQYMVLGLFFLLPIFFIPKLWATLTFDKVMLTVFVSAVVVSITSFSALRLSKAKSILPFSLVLFWLLVAVSFVSAIYNGDNLDSLRGSVFEVQTVGFLFILGLAMTIPLVLQSSKGRTLNAVFLFFISASALLCYCLLRVVFGAGLLPFGSFNAVTISPVGDFNDMGILSGLVIVFCLVSMAMLRLKTWLQCLMLFVVAVALSLLAVINFLNLWLVVGFFSLLVFIFILSRHTLSQSSVQGDLNKPPKILIIATAITCLVTGLFVVAGDFAGNSVAKVVAVDYAEVVPSFKGTVGIAREVYEEDALLGVGPNRFADAWRIHKDQNVNQTIFWDTDFSSGSGFVPTLFVNLGLLGGAAFIAFQLWFLYTGYRMLANNNKRDSYWVYVGVSSFSVASFVWVMSYVYEPGAAVLLIGALFTGVTFVSAGALIPESVKTFNLVSNRQRGFILMSIFVVIISSAFVFLISVTKQYVAQAGFNEGVRTTQSVEEFEKVTLDAFSLYPDDRFLTALAQLKLTEVGSLLSIASPSEEDQQRFLSDIDKAQTLIEQALDQDDTNPDSHAIRAAIYSSLAVAGIEGAKERAVTSLNDAQLLDPKNPGYYLAAAQMAVRVGDLESARGEIMKSLNLKPNYTEALYLLAQLDIGAGDVESAVSTVQSIITLEPRNPTRYFQLGVLLSSQERHVEAIEEFKTALRIDPEYANARYFMALTYIAIDQTDSALKELLIVAETNQDNVQLQELISGIQAGNTDGFPGVGLDTPVREVSPNEDSADIGVGRRAGETDLISPINTVLSNDVDPDLVDTEATLEEEVQDVDETVDEVVE